MKTKTERRRLFSQNSKQKTHRIRIISSFLVLFIALFVNCSSATDHQSNYKINLSGKWSFSLDSTDVGIAENWFAKKLHGTISLPGTTDDAGAGIPNTLEPKLEKPQILRLTRKNSYVGAAWYQKKVSIPQNWKNKNISLKLGRVIWESTLWVDGKKVDSQESLISSHVYDVSQLMTPGEHLITIRIDNRKKHSISVREMAHSYTNETQIIWNGIIGDICMDATDPVFVSNIQVYPDVENKICKVFTTLKNTNQKSVKGNLKIKAVLKNGNENLYELNTEVSLVPGEQIIENTYKIGDNMKLWDEFDTNLYLLEATIEGKGFSNIKSTQFGMRQLTNHDAKLQINGRRLFLRGTLECNIFPLTGHPPMDEQGWKKVFKTAKQWGLNHLRFHSWCPPEAAFAVADEMGFYLQVELPVWTLDIGKDEPTIKFLNEEANRIIREYGNHPSFAFWTLGNELQGDFSVLESLLLELKKKDTRHLYCTTAFTFEKGHGKWPEPNDDYFTTQITKKGWVRGQGLFDSEVPSFDKMYKESIEGLPVPLITHEIGQYAVFPNLKEIGKYTGVLTPLNFMAVRDDMERKGLLNRANDYLLATGKFAYLLYKEEIERAIKSDGLSGYQLLDLHDFPGQGTALVGLLDAFWDSKGIVTPNEFIQFSSPVVPFANFPKAVYLNNETFEAGIAVSNYLANDLENQQITWDLSSADGRFSKNGSLQVGKVNVGANSNLGTFSCPLNEIEQAVKLKLSLHIGIYSNSWEIWVYPNQLSVKFGEVFYTQNYNEAVEALQQGRKVLYNPNFMKINGLEGKFVPVFWSPVHFPNQAGTMGILCDPKHAAFSNFPTDFHSNWQWWDLNKKSRVINLDSLRGAEPILINIDNFNRNSSLSSIFEAKVGKGKLLLCTIDLSTDIEHRPVAKQLLYSLTNYMNGTNFSPKGELTEMQIKSMVSDSESKIDRGSIYNN